MGYTLIQKSTFPWDIIHFQRYVAVSLHLSLTSLKNFLSHYFAVFSLRLIDRLKRFRLGV